MKYVMTEQGMLSKAAQKELGSTLREHLYELSNGNHVLIAVDNQNRARVIAEIDQNTGTPIGEVVEFSPVPVTFISNC